MAEKDVMLLRLVITEEEDAVGKNSHPAPIVPSCRQECSEKEEEARADGQTGGKVEMEGGTCSEEIENNPGRPQQQQQQQQQSSAGDIPTGEIVSNKEDRQKHETSAETDTVTHGQHRADSNVCEKNAMRINIEKPEEQIEAEDEKVHSLKPSEEGSEGKEKDPKKVHRLTPDFPEALYELLCDLQEGRRLNDQRASFSLQGDAGGLRRRRCHSEPNAGKPANRVVFSSMTSLQKEEFFELVATTQARRLDDQRAQLEKTPKAKGRSFRGSIKQLSLVRRPTPTPAPAPVPVPVPKEDLYNMILATQAQGRLEEQRSRAPGPMDDEDFFSLLLRVQSGRMDEQRTELPGLLHA